MKKTALGIFVLCTCLIGLSALTFCPAQDPQTYYLDAVEGNDTLSGLSPEEAWKSLDRINQVTLQPGDKVLFERGGNWNGIFEPRGSGSENGKILISSYGTGEKPILNAGGVVPEGQEYSSTVRLFNQEYFEFRDFHIKNFAPGEGDNPKHKYGILVEGRDIGTLHDLKFVNVEVTDVNGSLESRENGGVCMLISRSERVQEIPSNFDGILVDSCYFYNNSRSAFLTVSLWKYRDYSSSFGEKTSSGKTNEWFPSYNIVVRNSHFEEVGGNGMVIRVAEAPLVEHNYFIRNSTLTTGNASYPYNCNNALWQFNEACFTVYNEGDVDASGFDSDYFCKNTIIQYNYSHDNEWGSLLVTSNGNISRAFNDGTIVRYNVFQNDWHHSVRVSGKPSNTYIYNNVMYIGAEQTDTDIIWHKSWGGYPDSTNYFNNIIYNYGTGSNYKMGKSTNNIFSNNIYFGNKATNEPIDPKKITSDPMLVNPGSGGKGFGTLDGYMIKAGSPAIDAGKDLDFGESKDFYGNPIPSGAAPDIGAHEYQQSAGLNEIGEVNPGISVSPNPAGSLTILDIRDEYLGIVTATVYDSAGIAHHSETFSKNGLSISRVLNLEGLHSGLYFIKVSSPAFAQTLNLVKTEAN